jgi:hypothetical protein
VQPEATAPSEKAAAAATGPAAATLHHARDAVVEAGQNIGKAAAETAEQVRFVGIV